MDCTPFWKDGLLWTGFGGTLGEIPGDLGLVGCISKERVVGLDIGPMETKKSHALLHIIKIFQLQI